MYFFFKVAFAEPEWNKEKQLTHSIHAYGMIFKIKVLIIKRERVADGKLQNRHS